MNLMGKKHTLSLPELLCLRGRSAQEELMCLLFLVKSARYLP